MALRQLVLPARRRTSPQVLTLPLGSSSAPALPRHAGQPASFKPLHRCHAAQAAPTAPSAGSGARKLSPTANSYISLGKFETMGGDSGRAAMGIAYLEEAIQMQEGQYANEGDARKKSAKALGLAQSRLQVGRQHHQQQDAAEAIAHYTRALELIEDAIAVFEKDGESASSRKAVKYARFLSTEILSALGVAYNDVGRRDEALTMLQRTLAERKEMLGKEHPSVAECLNNLGALFFGRRAFGKAAEHYEQALELLTSAAGGQQDGPYIALTFYNIGLCRMELAQLPPAVASMRKALRIAERSLGSDHHQVGLIKATLEQIMGQPVPSQGDPTGFPFPAAQAPPATSAGSAPAGAPSATQQKKEE